ncbi:MAG: hypothetical protein ABIH34_07495 [Nanoarchaeota archaeon]
MDDIERIVREIEGLRYDHSVMIEGIPNEMYGEVIDHLQERVRGREDDARSEHPHKPSKTEFKDNLLHAFSVGLSHLVKKVKGVDAPYIPWEHLLDFSDEIEWKYLPNAGLLYVLHVDFKGEGTDPKPALDKLCSLRAWQSMNQELNIIMVARPGANLDYRGYHNHPLGNWCHFYALEKDTLKEFSQCQPIMADRSPI